MRFATPWFWTRVLRFFLGVHCAFVVLPSSFASVDARGVVACLRTHAFEFVRVKFHMLFVRISYHAHFSHILLLLRDPLWFVSACLKRVPISRRRTACATSNSKTTRRKSFNRCAVASIRYALKSQTNTVIAKTTLNSDQTWRNGS